MPTTAAIEAAVAEATARRHGPAPTGIEPVLAAACRDMAARFRSGGVLHAMGEGVGAIDAAHVAVEFIHPVIVGKRSLPAVCVDPEDFDGTAPHDPVEGDIVLGLRLGTDLATAAALDAAAHLGCCTIDLAADHGPPAGPAASAAHVLDLARPDRLVAREWQVTCYHLLWELVHEQLDATGTTASPVGGGLETLYPFLAGDDDADRDATEPIVDLRSSTLHKMGEIDALRHDMLDRHAATLAAAGRAIARGGTVWTFGNGGSSTDAAAVAHLLRDRRLAGTPRRARSLTDDVATVTALTNDVRFDIVFARMLRTLARPGDVALGLSTSGNSANVVAGLSAAHELGCTTIGFAGYDGGDMAGLDQLDHLVVVPSSSVHRIQEAQTTLAHVLIEVARRV